MGNEQHDIINWKEVPHINGRVATEEDVSNGNAIFYINPHGKEIGHEPIEMDIPCLAYFSEEGEPDEIVIIVQAEKSNGDWVVGFRRISGEIGAGLFHQFTIINNQDEVLK